MSHHPTKGAVMLQNKMQEAADATSRIARSLHNVLHINRYLVGVVEAAMSDQEGHRAPGGGLKRFNASTPR